MGYNQPAYVPNPDAVQEFKVQTNGLSAEYGRSGGAVVNMVTRSGTKEFHGVLFEFLRNDALDAAGFFNNLNARGKGAFRYNQFGATLGGPLNPRSHLFLLQLRGRAPGQSGVDVLFGAHGKDAAGRLLGDPEFDLMTPRPSTPRASASRSRAM